MPEVVYNFLIEGGRATGGPPIGTTIGPLGINVQAVVKEINERTKEFEGITVPVKVFVDKEKKTFRIEVGTPSVASLIKKEIGLEKGAKGEPGVRPQPAGDIKFAQVLKIAKLKAAGIQAKDLRGAVLNVLGTCASVGVTCDGLDPKEVIRKVKAGEYDAQIK